jgi:hypothetical protein
MTWLTMATYVAATLHIESVFGIWQMGLHLIILFSKIITSVVFGVHFCVNIAS